MRGRDERTFEGTRSVGRCCISCLGRRLRNSWQIAWNRLRSYFEGRSVDLLTTRILVTSVPKRNDLKILCFVRFRNRRYVLFDTRWLRSTLFGFVDVFDVAFENQEVWRRSTIDLQCAAIIPLNRSFNLFSVFEHQDHWSMSIDLFFIIVDFGVRLCRRRLPLAYLNGRRLGSAWLRHSSPAPLPSTVRLVTLMCYFPPGFHICKRGSNKFTIHSSASKKIKKERLRRS